MKAANLSISPGTRVSIVEPIDCKVVLRARALSTEMAGYQLARVEGSELKLAASLAPYSSKTEV